MNVRIRACKWPLLRPPETFQNLGNQSECPAGALKRGEHERPRSNITGLEAGVGHREVGYVRFVAGWTISLQLYARLQPAASAAAGAGERREGIAAAWKQPRTSLIINFLRVIIAKREFTSGARALLQKTGVSRWTFAPRLFTRDSDTYAVRPNLERVVKSNASTLRSDKRESGTTNDLKFTLWLTLAVTLIYSINLPDRPWTVTLMPGHYAFSTETRGFIISIIRRFPLSPTAVTVIAIEFPPPPSRIL